jgi:hypothetical protein
MWPFDKKESVMFEEASTNALSYAPCGNPKTHAHWTEIEEEPCPLCTSIRKKKREEDERSLLADAIAKKVISGLETRAEPAYLTEAVMTKNIIG